MLSTAFYFSIQTMMEITNLLKIYKMPNKKEKKTKKNKKNQIKSPIINHDDTERG